jgi:hypothetical protein
MQVILDRDLAQLYQVETRIMIQAVKRNQDRFPDSFIFQLSDADKMGLRRAPYAFTEQGVAMLSAVLRSDTAIQVSIQIMQTFVTMRKFLINNASVFQRLDHIELKQLKTDEKLEQIFKALETGQIQPHQGVFFDGQIFDAYSFVSSLIREAKKSIILIDNYVDDTVLALLSKRNMHVIATIYTLKINLQLDLDLKKYNSQYPEIKIFELREAHDRFLILDEKELYHFGASLKDLGKKWFAFSKMDAFVHHILSKLQLN